MALLSTISVVSGTLRVATILEPLELISCNLSVLLRQGSKRVENGALSLFSAHEVQLLLLPLVHRIEVVF